MVRRYEEPIEVRTPSGPGEVGPDAFVWRGRFYQVREIIDHWQERRAWWREAFEEVPAEPAASEPRRAEAGRPGSSQAGVGASQVGASQVARQTRSSELSPSTERQVWRVAASPGRLAGTGVYDLGADGEPARWLLLCTQD